MTVLLKSQKLFKTQPSSITTEQIVTYVSKLAEGVILNRVEMESCVKELIAAFKVEHSCEQQTLILENLSAPMI